jgi:hypothetical protein
MPLILALLMFIPNWIFTILFMYFFWISVPQIYGAYIGQQDQSFCAMLPVSKKEIVKSKIFSLLILEALHLSIGFLFGIIHNILYGTTNFFFDINFAFFGLIVLLYAIYNIVFLPLYFKTGYYFGKPAIYGTIVTLIYGFIIEFSVIKYQSINTLFEGTIANQIIVLVIGVALSILLTIVTVRKSINNYENIS